MTDENTAWTLGSHVYGRFWDNSPKGCDELTEYIVIHRTRHFATIQLLTDRTVVYRKRVRKKDGEFLPVNIGAFWLRRDHTIRDMLDLRRVRFFFALRGTGFFFARSSCF